MKTYSSYRRRQSIWNLSFVMGLIFFALIGLGCIAAAVCLSIF